MSTLCELLEYRALPSNNSPWNFDEIWDELSDFQKAVESDIDPVLNTFGASRSIRTRQPGPVHFVGLFDAVAFEPELGESSNSRISLQGRVVRHAIAIDEKQIRFKPTTIVEHVHLRPTDPVMATPDDGDYDNQSLDQIWFPGTHHVSQKNKSVRPISILIMIMIRMWEEQSPIYQNLAFLLAD